jgi:hypothetical protein
MTQEKCERAVKALQAQGFEASYVQGAPDDRVWNDKLEFATSFRLHDEEIEYYSHEILHNHDTTR